MHVAGREDARRSRWPGVGLIWPLLGAAVLVFAAHEDLGLAGSGTDTFFKQWVNDALLWSAAAGCFVGALRSTKSRVAWFLVAAALASWATGDTIWSVRFTDTSNPPLTTVSDIFWLSWYPLIIAALVLLVRDRVPAFELHRWIDGVVVMLIVATPWVALFLQPVSEHSGASALADVVDFAYPLGDAVVFGATLGVFALMGWRPGRMWLILGLGLTATGIADAIYSVQALGQSYHLGGIYDAVWAGGAVLVAYAAWQPHPGRLEAREVTGWPAIALPLAAQMLAAAIQVYGLFHEIPKAERVLTLIVLLIAMVQIVVTRPRPQKRPADQGPT